MSMSDYSDIFSRGDNDIFFKWFEPVFVKCQGLWVSRVKVDVEVEWEISNWWKP